MPPILVAACVWRLSAELVVALDERFGAPLDAYVNGSQVWIRDDGPHREPLEWRLHPVPGYCRPKGVETEELFDTVTSALAGAVPMPAELDALWEGLECFAAYGDEIEPANLASAALDALGLAPHGVGLVDHEAVADAWEQSGRSTSIVEGLLEQIAGS